MPGTIEKRGKNSWRISIPGGYDEAGKRIWLARDTLHFDPPMTQSAQRKECEKALALLYARVEGGEIIDAKQVTVKEFSERWMKEHVRLNLSPMSAENYRSFLDRHILPALGRVKLRDLTPYAITKFLNHLRTEGLSGASVKHDYDTLSAMLSKAVQWRAIPYSPMKSVDPPKSETPPARFYDDVQALALLEALDAAPIKYRAAVYIALYGGLRIGETTGLLWEHINLEDGHIQVSQSLQYLPGKGTFTKGTKNNRARDFMLPQEAVVCIRELRRYQVEQRLKLGDAWQERGFLFTQWNGAPMHPDTPSQWLRTFLKKNSLPPLSFHSLRHTNASIMIAGGMDVETIKERLGHSRASITMDTYGHAFKHKDKKAADILDNALSRRR